MTEFICAYPANEKPKSNNTTHTNWPFFNKRKVDWPNKWTKAILIL